MKKEKRTKSRCSRLAKAEPKPSANRLELRHKDFIFKQLALGRHHGRIAEMLQREFPDDGVSCSRENIRKHYSKNTEKIEEVRKQLEADIAQVDPYATFASQIAFIGDQIRDWERSGIEWLDEALKKAKELYEAEDVGFVDVVKVTMDKLMEARVEKSNQLRSWMQMMISLTRPLRVEWEDKSKPRKTKTLKWDPKKNKIESVKGAVYEAEKFMEKHGIDHVEIDALQP